MRGLRGTGDVLLLIWLLQMRSIRGVTLCIPSRMLDPQLRENVQQLWFFGAERLNLGKVPLFSFVDTSHIKLKPVRILKAPRPESSMPPPKNVPKRAPRKPRLEEVRKPTDTAQDPKAPVASKARQVKPAAAAPSKRALRAAAAGPKGQESQDFRWWASRFQ